MTDKNSFKSFFGIVLITYSSVYLLRGEEIGWHLIGFIAGIGLFLIAKLERHNK